MGIVSILLAIFGLALLIVVHEWGHFIVARLCGMRVERFSIGFGNPIFKVKRGETIFQIAPIPLGGFVQITGLNPHEEFDHNDPNVYPNRPKWMRLAVLVAGPAANYLTAFLLSIPLFLIIGVPGEGAKIVDLEKSSAGVAAGLVAGDVIRGVNDRPVKKTEDIIAAVKESGGKPLHVQVDRGGKSVSLTVQPAWDATQKRYLMGVHLERATRQAGFGTAIVASVVYPIEQSKAILSGIWKMITRKVDANVAGPVGIARAMAAAAKRSMLDFLSLIIVLSIYLGLFNLLPFPALDGGRALFLGLSSIGLKGITAKVEAAVHMVGLFLLLGVFVIVTFNDIRKVITGEDDVASSAAQKRAPANQAEKPAAAPPGTTPAPTPPQGAQPGAEPEPKAGGEGADKAPAQGAAEGQNKAPAPHGQPAAPAPP